MEKYYHTLDDILMDVFRIKLDTAMEMINVPTAWIFGINYLFEMRKLRMECKFYTCV